MKKLAVLSLKYAVPIIVSALCAYGATLWIKEHNISGFWNVAFKWFSENASFYLALIACSRFLPAQERGVKEGAEPLLQLVVVEGLDTVLRCGFFYVSSLFPENEEDVTAWGSLGLDLVFLALVEKSHNLIEIARNFKLYEDPICLGLLQPCAA